MHNWFLNNLVVAVVHRSDSFVVEKIYMTKITVHLLSWAAHQYSVWWYEAPRIPPQMQLILWAHWVTLHTSGTETPVCPGSILSMHYIIFKLEQQGDLEQQV